MAYAASRGHDRQCLRILLGRDASGRTLGSGAVGLGATSPSTAACREELQDPRQAAAPNLSPPVSGDPLHRTVAEARILPGSEGNLTEGAPHAISGINPR